ncbi:hypothetical protein MM_3362 [Methanosarcina mazei Go1]|uniref:Uncharacterized protein n=1 Tax=Methanosarcina mazei (strain ATCC BAA-159 / DSM 3647 / Goe1 / Go1 / JCM 11833 / OCM 88) TaxID=192952 RepID=Q8PRT1_METMA|nr:hypothetical protein MM_3362 [Methanosarcina mazei Go1]
MLTNFSKVVRKIKRSFSFNPCFSGSCSRIRCTFNVYTIRYIVSILVLVDLAHEYYIRDEIEGELKVSILVLVDLAHEL